MLAMTVTITNTEYKRTKLAGQLFSNPDTMSPGFICRLEREPTDLALGGLIEIPGVGRESISATVARAIAEVIRQTDVPHLDLSRLRSLQFQAHSGQSLMVETSVWKNAVQNLGCVTEWHELSGCHLSAWQIAMHSLCDSTWGTPLVCVEPKFKAPPVYRHEGTIFCRPSDLLEDQQRQFEISHWLNPPFPVPLPGNACEPIEMDSFLCIHLPGYKASAARRIFWSDVESLVNSL